MVLTAARTRSPPVLQYITLCATERCGLALHVIGVDVN